MTITSRGPATVNVPIYSPNPRQTTVETESDVDVTLEGEREAYRFAHFSKIKRKAGTNWVQIKPRRDKIGLDVMFGRRPGGEKHSHYSYAARPKMIYLRNQSDTQLVRKLAFDGNDGAFVPVEDRIDDKATGMSLVLQFALRGQEIVVTHVQFFSTSA